MSEQTTLPMQFGVPLDGSGATYLFFGCLAGAVGLVFLFCRQKFGERLGGDEEYVQQLLPRHLATREEYTKGFLIYFGAMALSVVLLSLIGPKNLRLLGIPVSEEIGNVVVPLAIAFFWVGIMPNVPGLEAIERSLRRYAHEQAYIPAAALAIRERLAAADFDFSAYDRPEVLAAPELRGVQRADFAHPRRSLEHDWARLSALVYEQKSRRMAGLLEPLDADMIRAYEHDLEAVEDQRRGMESEVETYRAEKARHPGYENEALRRRIRGNLYRLYTLLGCAARIRRPPHHDVDVPLRAFGFRLERPSGGLEHSDLRLAAIAVVAVSALALGVIAVVLGKLELWTATAAFPANYYQPLVDTAMMLVPFAVAMAVADFMRQRARLRGTWLLVPRSRWPQRVAPYVRVGIAGGLAGYVAVVLVGVVLQAPTLNSIKFDAPKVLLAMVAAIFYVYHLDNVETGTRPGRLYEIAPQAIMTGLVGLVAAAASFDVIREADPAFATLFFGGKDRLPVDAILYAGAVCTAIGAALGAYIPEVAQARAQTPLAAARAERLRLLVAAATTRLGGEAAARAWIAAPHPALGERTPEQATEDIEGFEQVVALLERPAGVAA